MSIVRQHAEKCTHYKYMNMKYRHTVLKQEEMCSELNICTVISSVSVTYQVTLPKWIFVLAFLWSVNADIKCQGTKKLFAPMNLLLIYSRSHSAFECFFQSTICLRVLGPCGPHVIDKKSSGLSIFFLTFPIPASLQRQPFCKCTHVQ